MLKTLKKLHFGEMIEFTFLNLCERRFQSNWKKKTRSKNTHYNTFK